MSFQLRLFFSFSLLKLVLDALSLNSGSFDNFLFLSALIQIVNFPFFVYPVLISKVEAEFQWIQTLTKDLEVYIAIASSS